MSQPDPEKELTWEDLIEQDIREDFDNDEEVTWISPLDNAWLVDEVWSSEDAEWEKWHRNEYERIQAPGTRQDFTDHWNEKMRRKRDGIK